MERGANAFKSPSDCAEENLGVENACRRAAGGEVKQTVERIGPLVPAFATVGASVCASSLFLTMLPQALGPQPVVPPLTREVQRAVVSLSPPAQLLSRGRSRPARPADRRSSSAPARGSATSTPSLHHVSRQVSPIGASAPLPPPPNPPPAPTVTLPAPSVPLAQASAGKGKRPKDGNKPGWGHGDPNHVHTGPPGKGPKSQENHATTGGSGPPVAAGDQHGSSQNGDKKSPTR
jgi:hypothetical protein